jgi:hypothetical protein
MLDFLPVTLSNMDHYAASFTPPTVTHKVPKYLTTLFDCKSCSDKFSRNLIRTKRNTFISIHYSLHFNSSIFSQ